MNEVTNVQVVGDFILKLTFSDDEEKEVNLKPFIGKGFTENLLDPKEFGKVQLESGGGITWDNGFDFCPNFLRELEDVHNVAY